MTPRVDSSLSALASAVAAAKGGDPLAPVTVITPSTYSSVFVRRALAGGVDGHPGTANVTTTTVDGLVRALGVPALAAKDLRLAPPAVDAEAIRSAALDSGGPLGAVAGHPRTLTALQHAMAELRRCDDDVIGAIARRGQRGAGVATLVVAVRRRLNAHGLADAHDLVTAARRVAEGPSHPPGRGPIVCFELPELAPAERGVVRALMGHARSRELPPPGVERGCSAVVACADPDEEVRSALRAVIAGVEAGVGQWRHAIAYPAGTGYARIAQQQLAAAGVASNGPELRHLDRSMTARCLVGLLDLAEGSWRRDEMIAWLSCAPVRATPGGRPVPATRWDAVSAGAGVIKGSDQWHERLGRVADGGGRDAPEAEAMSRFVDSVIARAEPPGRSWGALADWSIGLLDYFLPIDDAAGWDPGEQAAAEQVRDLVHSLRDLDAMSGGTDLAGFRRTLRAELERNALDTRDLDAGGVGDGVFVGPLRDARGMRFATTVVVGLADASVPGLPVDDALVPDELCALDRTGALRTRAVRRAELRAELGAALATGIDRRVATYPRADPRNGRVHAPSRWLAELAGAGAAYEDVASFAASIALPGPAVTRSDLALRALAAESAAGLDVTAGPVAAAEPRLRSGLRAIRQRSGSGFTRFDGAVGAGLVSPFDPAAPVSATRFETFAACPRRYLLGRVLGIERRSRPEELWAIEPIERGTLLHAVLEEYVVERIAGTERSLERLLAIAEGRFAEAEAAGLVGKALLWRLEKAAMRRDLRTLFLEEGDLEPLAAELDFGIDKEGSDPPVAVPVAIDGGREVRFRGSADRVDRTSDGQLVVSDYKTGRQGGLAKLSKDPLAGGTRLQLPLYAMAARARFGGQGPVLARYWLVSGERQAPRYAVPLSDAVEARFRYLVGAIARGVAGGVFPGVPGKLSLWGFESCRWCDFDPVCPTTREREWNRKRSDPALRPVVDLREGAVPPDVQGAVTTDLLPDEVEASG